jgi:hypothetical protein
MNDIQAKAAALKTLSPRGRVALACCAVEHVLDMYRLGPVRYRASDFPGKVPGAASDEDLVELGLRIAWRYAAEGTLDQAASKALVRILDKISKDTRSDEWLQPAFGPINGLVDALRAIDAKQTRPAEHALTRSAVGVADLVDLFQDAADEDEVSTEDEDLEIAWQVRVAQRLVKLGDDIDRGKLEPLLAEQLPWRKLVEPYAKKSAKA